MKKIKKTPDEILSGLVRNLTAEHHNWEHHKAYGCNDPFWADGVNMNLLRNHIIWYRKKIMELCESDGLSLPEIYYIPVPPKVPSGYMASLNQKERVARIMQAGENITVNRPPEPDGQLSFL